MTGAYAFKWFLTFLFTFGATVSIAGIGEPRKPLTAGVVATSSLVTGLIIWGIWGLL